jgi:hypothetical protein
MLKTASSTWPFSNCQMRFPNQNKQKRHTQLVISRPGLREYEGFLEIQIVGHAILGGDMGAIGDLDPIANRGDSSLANQVSPLDAAI